MGKRRVTFYIVITLFVSILAVMSGFSQDDVTTVEDSAFEEKMRPSVPFMHDEHSETAEIEECNICHHVYEDGEKDEYESSEDMECSECHELDDSGNPMSLVKIYHEQCKRCHQEKKSGPIMCGECHIK
jgi:uncharacterized paraquat-inducible protein A